MRIKAIIIIILLAAFLFLFRDSSSEKIPVRKINQLSLENFKKVGDHGEVEIDVTDGVFSVAEIKSRKQIKNIDKAIEKIKNNNKEFNKKTDKKGIITLKLGEDEYNQPTIVIFENSEKKVIGYIEFLRQSEKKLKELFDFNRKGGHTILGRTNIKLKTNPKFDYSTQNFSIPMRRPFPNIQNFFPQDVAEPEIAEAIAIMRYIWTQPLMLGPTNEDISEDTGLLRRLELLRNGEWSTQCASLRNIFLNFALYSKKIEKVRRVELEQYHPAFPDLIPNQHSSAEIYVKNLKKWILVDAWYGYLFKLDGNYLNAEDIINMPESAREKIQIEKWANGRNSLNDLPDENGSIDIILSDGYLSYFGSVIYGPERKLQEATP